MALAPPPLAAPAAFSENVHPAPLASSRRDPGVPWPCISENTLRRGFRFPAILHWWHLLSLDAPSVAALWSWSMARSMHLHLPWTSPLILALGTWLVYVADRILDGLPAAAAHLRERHLFYLRNRARIMAVAIAVSGVLLWLIVTRMSPSARREDTALLTAALVYFSLIHLCGRLSRIGIERWFPKEAAVAIVFVCAVAVPAWSRLSVQRAHLVTLVAIFALLCWLNCVTIEKWESPEKWPLFGSPSHFTTLWTCRHLRLVSWTIALLAALASLASIFAGLSAPIATLYAACAISAAAFPLLDRSTLHSSQLRIAADAALLTPILFLPVLR